MGDGKFSFYRRSTETQRLFRENFVCVEPGVVRGFVEIRPGESWVGQQVLNIV